MLYLLILDFVTYNFRLAVIFLHLLLKFQVSLATARKLVIIAQISLTLVEGLSKVCVRNRELLARRNVLDRTQDDLTPV